MSDKLAPQKRFRYYHEGEANVTFSLVFDDREYYYPNFITKHYYSIAVHTMQKNIALSWMFSSRISHWWTEIFVWQCSHWKVSCRESHLWMGPKYRGGQSLHTSAGRIAIKVTLSQLEAQTYWDRSERKFTVPKCELQSLWYPAWAPSIFKAPVALGRLSYNRIPLYVFWHADPLSRRK